jgi:DnaJ-class molecular chaperone
MYDLHGNNSQKQSTGEGGMGGGSGGQSYGGYDGKNKHLGTNLIDFFAGEDFGDFFNDWMNMSNMNQPSRGRDVLLNIDISF